MAPRATEEFKRDAVRIALTSGLTRKQASSDFGVEMSPLNKWFQQHQNDDLMSGPLRLMLGQTFRMVAQHFNYFAFCYAVTLTFGHHAA
jgi:transposase-like protein